MFLKKIAVLDDDPAIVELYINFLGDEGYKIIPISPTRKLKEIINLIWTEKPDLLILDIRLPGLKVFEIITRLKKEKELQNLKILLCSAARRDLNELTQILNQTNLKVDGSLEKPFDLDQLAAEVARLLDFP